VGASLRAASRPRGEGGAATKPARTGTLRGMASLLENPPSPRVDRPHETAWNEEHLLGVALTCSKADGYDQADVNVTCKEVASGRTGFLLLGVKVDEAREVRTKKGANPGQKMAFLTVSDRSGAAGDVVCFPDAWKEFSTLLVKDNCVYLHVERDQKKGGLVVRRVSQMVV
jgi:DNA polymerase III alpha subunit